MKKRQCFKRLNSYICYWGGFPHSDQIPSSQSRHVFSLSTFVLRLICNTSEILTLEMSFSFWWVYFVSDLILTHSPSNSVFMINLVNYIFENIRAHSFLLGFNSPLKIQNILKSIIIKNLHFRVRNWETPPKNIWIPPLASSPHFFFEKFPPEFELPKIGFPLLKQASWKWTR